MAGPFDSAAFGGSGGSTTYADPSVGAIANNLGQAIFGNPADYARNAYYGAETRKSNQETYDLQDAQQSLVKASDAMRDPAFWIAPPGVDPANWAGQNAAKVIPDVVRASAKMNPQGTAEAAKTFMAMLESLRGDNAGGLTSLNLQGRATDENTATTPAAQAQIAARNAGNALTRATAVANIDASAKRYGSDQQLKASEYDTLNRPVIVGPGSTGYVSPNSPYSTDANKGVLSGSVTKDTAEGSYLDRHPNILPSIFNPPVKGLAGESLFAVPSDARFGSDATRVDVAPKTTQQKMPKLTGADNIELQSDIAHSFDPDHMSGLERDQQATNLGTITANLTPDELAEMNDQIAKEYQASNSLQAAGAAGASYLKSKLKVASGLSSLWGSRYSRIAPAPAAPAVPAATSQQGNSTATQRVPHIDPATGDIWTPTADGGWSVTPGQRK